MAGSVKRHFESHAGVTAFVAHDDIEPSAEWRKEILEHLDSCDALVALVTPKFGGSAYANQEVGIVIGRGKPPISLWFNGKLPGFLEMYQAVRVFEPSLDSTIEEIVRAVRERGLSHAPPERLPSIVEAADKRLDEKTRKASVVDNLVTGRPVATKIPQPRRRILVKADNIPPDLIAHTQATDDWLGENRPSRLLDWTDKIPTQRGLVFESRSARIAEIAYDTGEIYFGDIIERQDGVNIGATILIVGEMMRFAANIFRHFGYGGPCSAELKLMSVKNMPLTTDPGRDLAHDYKARHSEIVVKRLLADDMLENLNSHVEDIITEMCRAFGFSIQSNVARGHVTLVLGSY